MKILNLCEKENIRMWLQGQFTIISWKTRLQKSHASVPLNVWENIYMCPPHQFGSGSKTGYALPILRPFSRNAYIFLKVLLLRGRIVVMSMFVLSTTIWSTVHNIYIMCPPFYTFKNALPFLMSTEIVSFHRWLGSKQWFFSYTLLRPIFWSQIWYVWNENVENAM